MIGKKNIVFGLVFFIFTASLGIMMVNNINGDVKNQNDLRKTHVGELKTLKIDNYEKDLDKLSAADIAKASVDGVIALNNYIITRQEKVNDIKAQPHAHGNLESLLNIVIGILLGFLAVSRLFKQLISWAFILGTLLHSGMMFLSTVMLHVFEMTPDSVVLSAVMSLLETGAGPVLILLGLLLTAVASIMGFRSEIVQG